MESGNDLTPMTIGHDFPVFCEKWFTYGLKTHYFFPAIRGWT
jgi:hypothetical protein